MLALEKTGFRIDSSISSQRFDGPFSYGTRMKFNWLSSPRGPYNPSRKNPFLKGNSTILEIPVSAMIVPYITTTMRISPPIFRYLEKYLLRESKNAKTPIVMLTHPNEYIYEKSANYWKSGGFNSYLRDNLRTKLKLKNLGKKGIDLLEQSLKLAKKNGFEFISMESFSKK